MNGKADKQAVGNFEKESLKRGLESRHIQMIAFGGTIGTGLFFGSAYAIKTAGPAVLLTYILVGIAVFFIMRALGEMAVEEPVSGSYISYSNRYVHRFLGFLLGYNVMFGAVASAGADFNALGMYVQMWFPDFPIWVTSIGAIAILFAMNIISVKIYGEVEFWLSLVKIVAIVLMICFGIAMIFFGIHDGGNAVGLKNLTTGGGFFAQGLEGVLMSLVMVAFAYGGVENVGAAAGEAKNVKRTIPKAVNAIFWRILIFYVGAIAVMLAVTPWQKMGTEGSPFVKVFTIMGIPGAASIINFVVITAVFSALNGNNYTGSRAMYNLSLQKNAPAFLSKVSGDGVPYAAVIAHFVLMSAGIVANYFIPHQLFHLFASMVAFSIALMWGSIILSHLKFRKLRILNGTEHLISFKMPFYPYGDYIALGFLALMVVMIGVVPSTRIALVVAAVWASLVFVAFKIYEGRAWTRLNRDLDVAANRGD